METDGNKRDSIYTITTSHNSRTSSTVNFAEIGFRRESEQPTTRFGRIQSKLRSFVNHLAFRIFSFCLIMTDIIILVLDLSLNNKSISEQISFDAFGLLFVVYFFMEVNLRLTALGYGDFCKMWFNVVDYVVVIVSFVITIIYTSVTGMSEYAKLVVIGRLVRVTIFIRLFTERKQLERGMRHLVSQNKRRYQFDGFDLDLTYVTDRVIAMSFPSSGKMAMYRNPIKEVGRFLDTKHRDHFKVYNLCSERSYNVKHFHRRVEQFPFDDHNPPLLNLICTSSGGGRGLVDRYWVQNGVQFLSYPHFCQMFSFTKSVKVFLDSDPLNVVAVHCKGGKGRTGTMVSVWLIESGQFDSALESLDYFGTRRTDLALGDKYQGVETPSQNRYVNYYSYIKYKLNGVIPKGTVLKLDTIKITSIKGVGKGNGKDFTIEIQNGFGNKVFSSDLSKTTAARKVHFCDDEDYVRLELLNGPLLVNDVKVLFHCSSPNVPCEHKDVAFFFWFHTGFIENHRVDCDIRHCRLNCWIAC